MLSISSVQIKKDSVSEYIEAPFTEYYHANGDNYKRWSFKNVSVSWGNATWNSHDMLFEITSKGKACFSCKISLNIKRLSLRWMVELLDEERESISSVRYAPVVFENIQSVKGKKIENQKQCAFLDTKILNKVMFIRMRPIK